MDKINFNDEFVEKIITGKKIVTRRLVKEGEYLAPNNYKYEDSPKDSWICLKNKKGIAKWQVGKEYDVCVGGKQIWYCLKCNNICNIETVVCNKTDMCKYDGIKTKSLKIKVTGITKEKILDITLEEAKLEGFKSKIRFIEAFAKIYYSEMPEANKNLKYGDVVKPWNPFVWVIKFEVVK